MYYCSFHFLALLQFGFRGFMVFGLNQNQRNTAVRHYNQFGSNAAEANHRLIEESNETFSIPCIKGYYFVTSEVYVRFFYTF